MKIRTNTQIEGILRTAFCLDGNSIKDVAETTGIWWLIMMNTNKCKYTILTA